MNKSATHSDAVNKLIADIQSADDNVRGAAWQGAATFGASAVKPLGEMMTHDDFEIARAAKRALWKIVHRAGRPKADRERKAVQAELLSLLQTASIPVRREAVWMLSEIGDSGAVSPLEALFADASLREDIRCALERIPMLKAKRALAKALNNSPDDFRPAIAHSIRARDRRRQAGRR